MSEPTPDVVEASTDTVTMDSPSTPAGESSSPSEVSAVEDVSPASDNACCSYVANMDPRVRNLIYWVNPIKSAAVFVGSIMLLMTTCCCGLLNSLAFIALLVLAFSFCIHAVSSVAKRFLNKTVPNPLQSVLSTPIAIPEDKVQCLASCAAKCAERVVRELCRLYTIVDIPDSFKFGIMLWLVYWLTSRMSFITMLTIADVLLFIVPKVCDVYRVQIQAAVGAAKAQALQLLERARTLPYVDQAVKVLAPPKEKQS